MHDFLLIYRLYYSCLLSLKLNGPTMQSQNCSWGSAEFSYPSCILQGKLEAQIKTKLHLQLGALKQEFNPSWEYKLCKTILVFYSIRCEEWTAMELIPLKRAFRDHNSPFCIWGAVMGKFLNSPNWETVKNEGIQREIPYTLFPTNLLISLLPAPQLRC